MQAAGTQRLAQSWKKDGAFTFTFPEKPNSAHKKVLKKHKLQVTIPLCR
jgi:hypothetical protein